jgi:hypothetical protein
VISELNRNPKMLINIFEKNVQLLQEGLVQKLDNQIKEEVKKGILRPISAKNLMTNTVSLCIFPIVARPVLQGILFENNKKEYDEFLIQRKDFVKDYIINSIKA